MSYKLPLIKALPSEMKFLNSYAFAIGAKLIVDNSAGVGLIKNIESQGSIVANLSIHYPEEASPPEGITSIQNFLEIATEDNLESKKDGILQLYQWTQQLNENLFNKVELILVPEDAPPEEQSYEAWLTKINMEP